MSSGLSVSWRIGRAMHSYRLAEGSAHASAGGACSSIFLVGAGDQGYARFSETESLAILSVLLARYRVEVKEEPQFAGETFEQRRERLLKVKAGITST